MKIQHRGGVSEFLTRGASIEVDGELYDQILFEGNALIVSAHGSLERFRLDIPPTNLAYARIYFGPDFYQVFGWKDGKQVSGPRLSLRSFKIDGQECTGVTRGHMADGYVYTGKITPVPHGRNCGVWVADGGLVSTGTVQVFPGQSEVQWFVREPCETIRLRQDGGEWHVPGIESEWYVGNVHYRRVILPSGNHFHSIVRIGDERIYNEFVAPPCTRVVTICRGKVV